MFALGFVTVREKQFAVVYYQISNLALLPLLSVNNYMQNEVFLGSLHIVTWPVHLEVLVNFSEDCPRHTFSAAAKSCV